MSAQTPTSDNSLEAGLFSTTDEKRALDNSTNPPRSPVPQRKSRMATLRRFLLALTVSVLVSLTIAAHQPIRAIPRGNANDVAVNDGAAGDQSFAQIISDALGNKIVQIARRQNNNSTSDPTETLPTSQEPEPTSEQPSQEPSQPPASSTPPTSKAPEPSNPEPTPSSTDKNPGTSSPDEPSSSSPGSTDPLPPASSTLSPSSSSQVPSSSTSSERPEPTPSSKQTTSRSAATTNTRTSTLPGGGITIITSTSYYDVVPQPTGDSNGDGSDPELQNAAPGQNAVAIIPALFGIVAAMAL